MATSGRTANKSGRPSAGLFPIRSLSLPSRPYGKRSSSRSFRRAAACSAGASVTPPITPAWLQSPEQGLPLLLPRAGETVAAGAVHRLARPHALQARPRRPSVPDRRPASAQMPGQAGHNGEAVTVGSRQTLHSSPSRSFRSRFSVCQPCKFNPSQPPKGGAINARAASSLRITAGAKNPRHNITQHCITPRESGGSQNQPWRGAWDSPPNRPCACCGLYNVMLC